MNPQAMTQTHQATPWAWTLDARQAVTLLAANGSRWVRVEEGCVWLTAHHGEQPAKDIWLCAGQSLALPAGTAWVMEAWPQARLSLLLATPPEAPSRAAPWWRAPSRALLRWWSSHAPVRWA
jgi:hypothetical protein